MPDSFSSSKLRFRHASNKKRNVRREIEVLQAFRTSQLQACPHCNAQIPEVASLCLHCDQEIGDTNGFASMFKSLFVGVPGFVLTLVFVCGLFHLCFDICEMFAR